MSFLEEFRLREDVRSAQRAEPALRDRRENERRGETLERIRRRAAERGAEYARAQALAGAMAPNSVPWAWDALGAELAGLGDGELAGAALEEGMRAREEVWRGMRGDADVVAQVMPLAKQFRDAYAEALSDYRRMLGAMAAHMGPLGLGAEMLDHVVNMARFGSGADDWMVRTVIAELYLGRGLFGEACDMCERMIQFEGHDMARMAGSTLIERVLGSVLGRLRAREEPGRAEGMAAAGLPASPGFGERGHTEALAQRCLGLLERRAACLGLEIRPDPAEGDLLRRASDFARAVQERRRARGVGEVAAHILGRYPESCAFLGLQDAAEVERLVTADAPLVRGVREQMDAHRTAEIRNVECPAVTALDWLEPMIRLVRGDGLEIKAATRKRWSEEARSGSPWECVFEADLFLRLLRAGAEVETDVAVPGTAGGDVADMRVDGCLAEVCSLPEGGAGDPGQRLVRDALGAARLGGARGDSTVVIARCSGADLGAAMAHRNGLAERLGAAAQPGAVLFVSRYGRRYGAECVVNPRAAARVPERAMRSVREALALEAPWRRA